MSPSTTRQPLESGKDTCKQLVDTPMEACPNHPQLQFPMIDFDDQART